MEHCFILRNFNLYIKSSANPSLKFGKSANLPKERKYLKIIYLIRGHYSKYVKNSHTSIV